MLHGYDGRTAEVTRLLAGAARTIANVPYCWLVTTDGRDGSNARPMGRIPPDPGEDALAIRLLADGRTRKVEEIRRYGRVTVTYEDLPSDAFVMVVGRAVLQEEPSEVRRRWKRSYDVYFPSDAARAAAAFIEVSIERLELWIGGVTPEPFGMRPTILERDAQGGWRVRCDEPEGVSPQRQAVMPIPAT